MSHFLQASSSTFIPVLKDSGPTQHVWLSQVAAPQPLAVGCLRLGGTQKISTGAEVSIAE